MRNAVEGGILEHPDVEIGVAQPGHCLGHRIDCAEHDLRVQHVGQTSDQLGLDWELKKIKYLFFLF